MWKSRLLYSLCLIGSLLLAFGFGDGSVGLAIFYALILLLLCSIISILVVPRLLSLEHSQGEMTIFKGETVPYSVLVRNRTPFFYPRIRCRIASLEETSYHGSTPMLFSLGPLSKHRRDYLIDFPYRGVYPVGVEEMEVTDFLGLFQRTMRPQSILTVTVYPEQDETFLLSLHNEPQNASLTTDLFSEDYTSVADVRKYSTSDSLRKIHWKLSARRGELMVKNFNAYQPDRTVLLLDARPLPLSRREQAAFEDRMISYLATAVDYCIQGRLPAELLYGETQEDRLLLSQMAGDTGEAFRRLAGIRFDADESPVMAAEELPGSYNLIVFLSQLDGGIHQTLRELISFDHHIILYYFFSPQLPLTEEQDYYLESLSAYGAAINRVDLGLTPGS